jgi:DNA-binding transcriptional MerR regulator
LEEAGSVLLKTKDVLKETGISRQMLYRYITAGLIREETMTDSGRRLFSPEVINRIELIRRINRSGYALREIREIFFRRK